MVLSEAEVEDIRADCFANDVAYNYEVVKNWDEEKLREFFENGGGGEGDEGGKPAGAESEVTLSEHAQVSTGTPALVAFYSGGLTPAEGKKSLANWLAAASAAGFTDQLVLDNTDGREGWGSYVDGLVHRVDAELGSARPVFITGHSRGATGAFALAERLGARVRKFYPIASRPISSSSQQASVLMDAWGVVSRDEVLVLPAQHLLKGLVETWNHRLLRDFAAKPEEEWPVWVRHVAELIRHEYGRAPCWPPTSDEGPVIAAPIMPCVASKELPNGETASRMEGWRHHTSSPGFELALIEDVDHFGIMQYRVIRGQRVAPLFDVLVADMLASCSTA